MRYLLITLLALLLRKVTSMNRRGLFDALREVAGMSRGSGCNNPRHKHRVRWLVSRGLIGVVSLPRS